MDLQSKEKVSLEYYKGPDSHELKCRWTEARSLLQLLLSLNSQSLVICLELHQVQCLCNSAWLPLLSLELKPLLFQPTQEQAQIYYLACFKNYKNVS